MTTVARIRKCTAVVFEGDSPTWISNNLHNWIVICEDVHLMHWKVVSSVPGLWLSEASISPLSEKSPLSEASISPHS